MCRVFNKFSGVNVRLIHRNFSPRSYRQYLYIITRYQNIQIKNRLISENDDLEVRESSKKTFSYLENSSNFVIELDAKKDHFTTVS